MVRFPNGTLQTEYQYTVWHKYEIADGKLYERNWGPLHHRKRTTTSDKLLIDFVTRKTRRPDSKALKEKYPSVYDEVLKTSESRKVKVRIEPA